MFPADIGGFVTQAERNTALYTKLSIVPIILLAIMMGLLVFNAAKLTTILDEHEAANIFSIVFTRMPYVIIATAIIGAAYKLAAILIAEIMRINQQRLNMSKIIVIATDVSRTSAQDLMNLSDDEKVTIRNQLKMDMLRDHLRDYLSKDFKPQPVKIWQSRLKPQDAANHSVSEKPED